MSLDRAMASLERDYLGTQEKPYEPVECHAGCGATQDLIQIWDGVCFCGPCLMEQAESRLVLEEVA